MGTTISLARWTLLASLVFAVPVGAADDAYIRELQDAAKAQERAAPAAPTQQPAGQPDGWPATNQDLGGALPSALSQQQFEETLKKNFFGTYMFYSKLDEAGKAAVYREYQSNNQLSHIRDKTMTLLKQ